MAAIALGRKNIHLLVIIPGVTALVAGGAKVYFGLLFDFGLRIQVGRRKQDLCRTRSKESAGGLAHAWGNSVTFARPQIEKVNLIERISRLALALENQRRAVRGKVS